MYVVFALVAVTQFNIEINAKVKYPTHLDITGKKNKARFISLVLICYNVCNLLGCVYSMGSLQSHHLHNRLIFQWHNIVFYGQLTE